MRPDRRLTLSDDSDVPTVWLFRAGRGGSLAEHLRDMRAAAMGVGPDGSIEGLSRNEALRFIIESHADREEGSMRNFAYQLFRFANLVEIGDWLLTPMPQSRSLLLGRIEGPYRYCEPPPAKDLHHVRAVDWQAHRSRDLLPKRVQYSLGSLLTLSRPSPQAQLLAFAESRSIPTSPQ